MEKLHYQTEYLPYFTHTTFGSILSGTLVFPFGYPKINGATAIYPSGAPISLRSFSSTRARWAPPIQQLPIPMDSAASIIVCAAIAQSYTAVGAFLFPNIITSTGAPYNILLPFCFRNARYSAAAFEVFFISSSSRIMDFLHVSDSCMILSLFFITRKAHGCIFKPEGAYSAQSMRNLISASEISLSRYSRTQRRVFITSITSFEELAIILILC